MKKIIKFGLIILIVILEVFSDAQKQRYAEKEFKVKSDAYCIVRDFLISKTEDDDFQSLTAKRSGEEWEYIYSYEDEGGFPDSYEISDKNVKSSLELLEEVEETSFDFCKVRLYEETTMIAFTYDWESAYNCNYNIYWCEDEEKLKQYLEEEQNYKISFKELEDNWYYVDFE